VSVDALLPTDLARNDEVTVITADAQVRGTVVSARTDGASAPAPPAPADPAEDGEEEGPPQPVRAPTTDGGEGRLTVAVTRTDAGPLVRADRARVVVESRGVRREYELVSLLRRAGRRFRRVTVGADGPLDGTSLGVASVREQYGVAVMAVEGTSGWRLAPRGETTLSAGDDVYVVGTPDRLDAFVGAVS
jgi:hypothetical protein